jgi:hypothetical protein
MVVVRRYSVVLACHELLRVVLLHISKHGVELEALVKIEG